MATANASRSVSPGAALLRSSRMFSMPAPISAPSNLSLATKHKSQTATAPFPTHLSVTTPESSRAVGDWGFKRPFPLRTTTKSTLPLIRVRKVDSIEQVTDFQSASDHTITLKKWQEMNMDITVPQDSTDNKPCKSVFEDHSDVTALSSEDRVKQEHSRWKFNGPWLAGMTDGEFEQYLSSTVRERRSEFRDYLKQQRASDLTEEQAKQANERAEEAPAPVMPSDITEEALTEYLRQLRGDRVLLFQHVSRFLDLAPLAPELTVLEELGKLNPGKQYEISLSPYARNGPPITHPSAGLSYLRTKSYLDNHPIYGPQQYHPPVKARIVTPRQSSTNYIAKIGVGGFISKIPEGETSFNYKSTGGYASRDKIPGLNDFLPSVEGGSKVYVNPHRASIDPKGKVILQFQETNPIASTVHKEMVGEGSVFEDAVKEKNEVLQIERPMGTQRSPRQYQRTVFGSSANYGLNQ
ncbi:putative Mitochondrial ribosomal protein MRP51 [Seiridium cardinale]|uniref:Mitochondrial ribosomal protein MRP51 n=1 Tax=Seiridium cardinale TaxID=138064 RepID=A0ABR2X9B6_9PEZI